MQAGEETTRLFGGTGLGLSIVRKLIELHQSTIHIDSNIGRGAIFSFTIQFDRRHADSYPSNRIELSTHNYQQLNANRENANPPTIQRRTENLSILLVEDHQLNQIVATDLLKKWSPTPDRYSRERARSYYRIAQKKLRCRADGYIYARHGRI